MNSNYWMGMKKDGDGRENQYTIEISKPGIVPSLSTYSAEELEEITRLYQILKDAPEGELYSQKP